MSKYDATAASAEMACLHNAILHIPRILKTHHLHHHDQWMKVVTHTSAGVSPGEESCKLAA